MNLSSRSSGCFGVQWRWCCGRMSKHYKWCFQWDQGKLVCCFTGSKCYRISRILHGQALLLMYWMIFFFFRFLNSKIWISCFVLVFFVLETQVVCWRGKNCPRKENTKFPYLLKNRRSALETVIPHSSKNRFYKCSRESSAPGLMLKSALWCPSLLNPDEESISTFFCCVQYCRMPAFIGIFLFLLSACFAVASFHHTSSLLAVPISLSGFKKVSRNNESVPDKGQVINPLLSSSYSKKTGMSLGHSVCAAPCCLSILFDRGTQNRAAQFLDNSRLVISHLKCSWSLVSLVFFVFAIAPAEIWCSESGEY